MSWRTSLPFMLSLACSTIAFQTNRSEGQPGLPLALPDICRHIAQAGFDGIELWGPHLDGVEGAALEDLGTLIRSLGLSIPLISPYFNFTKSPDHAAASLRQGLDLIGKARRLGAAGIRVFTGNHRSADATPEQWDRCITCLKTLCDAASPMIMAVHVHDWNLVDTPDSTLKLLSLVDRPNCQILHKPAYFRANPLAATRLLAARVFLVQCLGPTDQDLPWSAILDILSLHHPAPICSWTCLDGRVLDQTPAVLDWWRNLPKPSPASTGRDVE